jgi:metabolite-proton symporter
MEGAPLPGVSMLISVERKTRIGAVVRVASGNFLEMYDFMVYGYYASAIAAAFFPGKDPVASLMAALATFGAGFLMRPLGAIILGAYIDHNGRRKGLILTLALMAIGTLSIAIVPGYAVLGIVAPFLVLLGRLLQGFSAGVELGGVSVYLAEIATPGHKGFYTCWQSGSQQIAVVFAASLGALLNHYVSPPEMTAWGWRIPLLIGCAIIPFVFFIRRSLAETDEFLQRKHHPTAMEIFRSTMANWPVVLTGVMLVTMTTVSFYTITAYTPTFGEQVLNMTPNDSYLVTLCVGLTNLIWLPISGALSDRVGRRPILIACALLALVTAYPAMSWLVVAPSFGRLLMVELWLSFIYGCWNGAMVPFLTEIMPAEARTSGFSLAYSLATALFGGFTPLIATWLIRATGNKAMPGAWLSLAALSGLLATLVTLSFQSDINVEPVSPAKAAA